jgi:predicted nucleotidyltransferase
MSYEGCRLQIASCKFKENPYICNMLDKNEIEKIVELLKERFNPEKIILFGSQARGTADKDSDIDLLIVAETDIPRSERYPEVCRTLREFHYAFDAFLNTPEEYNRWRRILNNIIYFADKYGVIIYQR